MARFARPSSSKGPRLLRSHSNRAIAIVLANFEPQISFLKRIPNAAEAVMKRIKAPHWGMSPDNRFLIRETTKKFIYVIDFQSFFCQTLGLDPWIENIDDHIESMSIAFNKMDVTRLKSVAFVVAAWIPLGMSHAEICDLVFGSLMVNRSELASTYGNLGDVLLQLHGTLNGFQTRTIIAPQTVEQAGAAFLATNHLDSLLEPRLLDTSVKDFHDQISHECLFMSIELKSTDFPVSSIGTFVRDAMEAAERIAEETVLSSGFAHFSDIARVYVDACFRHFGAFQG